LLKGGAGIHGSMLRAGLVDEVVIVMAPKLLGGDGVSITSGKGPLKMSDSIKLENMKTRKLGDDLMITATVRKI
jgi:diaminohydroxyphosphoribosylaminopyrimidine deaminase / 5-amino-6-(5-phosphoribosylamino)uracil reductase